MLLTAAALVLLVLILPRRTVRVFGERKARFPFRGLGRLFQILAVTVMMFFAIDLGLEFTTLRLRSEQASAGRKQSNRGSRGWDFFVRFILRPAREPSAERNRDSSLAFPAMNRWAFFCRPAERDCFT